MSENGGVNADEDKVLRLLGEAYNAFAKLPKEHAADLPEFVIGIHLCQNVVLARPTLRAMKGRSQ